MAVLSSLLRIAHVVETAEEEQTVHSSASASGPVNAARADFLHACERVLHPSTDPSPEIQTTLAAVQTSGTELVSAAPADEAAQGVSVCLASQQTAAQQPGLSDDEDEEVAFSHHLLPTPFLYFHLCTSQWIFYVWYRSRDATALDEYLLDIAAASVSSFTGLTRYFALVL